MGDSNNQKTDKEEPMAGSRHDSDPKSQFHSTFDEPDPDIDTYTDGSSIHTINDSRDKVIIQSLCENILPNYNINIELLLNWQVELTDDLSNLSTIIQEDIIISDNELAISYGEMESFTDQVLQLEDSRYGEFKLIIIELLINVISVSYTNRIQLFKVGFHKYLIDKLLDKLKNTRINLDSLHKLSIINQLFRLVVIFLELGCDIKSFRKLIIFLFKTKYPPQGDSEDHSTSSETSRLIVLELLEQIFTKYPSHFKSTVINKITAFPFVNVNYKKKLSIQSWFKINNLVSSNEDPITLFVLTNSDAQVENQTSLKIQVWNYNKISVEIKNHQNGSRIQFTFNQILNFNPTEETASSTSNQGYFHLVLTYDNYSNLNLFIDGEYSESIPCPEIHKAFSSWNKVYIGNDYEDPTQLCITDELLVKNLSILDTNLSHEWICLLYNLGLGYDWEYKELSTENLLNLLNHLSPRGLLNVAIKFNDLKGRKKDFSIDTFVNIDRAGGSSGFLKKLSDRASSSKLNVFKDQVELIDKHTIVESLTKLKQENVLFDTNEFFQSLHEQEQLGTDTLQKKHSRIDREYDSDSHSSGSNSVRSPSFVYHNSPSLHAAFYTIGGTSLILKLIETSLEIPDEILRDCSIYKSFSLLFTILNNNWRLNKEFENINGYNVLSILLTKYKQNFNQSLTLKVLPEFEDSTLSFLSVANDSNTVIPKTTSTNILNLILKSSGYDFINESESIIINPSTYRFLLLNFDLFYDTECFENLLHHFQILIDASKYKVFNNRQLFNMKLLKKLIQFLKSPYLAANNLPPSVCEELNLTISSIVKSDTSVDTIKTISLYVNYALYNSECSTELGIVVLKSLTDILCDSNSSIRTLKKFSRSITIHWILLLFNIKSKEVVSCGIRLLSKLLKILGPHIIKKFFQVNHGLDTLTHFLRDWWDNDQILGLLFMTSFGLDNNNKAEDLITIQKKLSGHQLVIPEFLILINNLVLNSMYTLRQKNGKLLSSNPSSPRRNAGNQSPATKQDLTLLLNVLHLLNEYVDSIKYGFDNSSTLHQFYLSKEFLDGVFELLGHLKLSVGWNGMELVDEFELVTNKLIKTLSSIFIENFINNSFLSSLENLNPSTRVLILDYIFPRIFEHINQFINVSNFIFNEKKFLEGSILISNYYLQEFVRKNYYIKLEDLDSFITCVCSIIEVGGGEFSGMKKIRKELGSLIILKLQKISELFRIDDSSDEAKLQSKMPSTKFDDFIKILKFLDSDNEGELSIQQGLPSIKLAPAFETKPNDKRVETEVAERSHHKDTDKGRMTVVFKSTLKFLLYRQMTILEKDIFNDKNLGELLTLVLGIFVKFPKSNQAQEIEYLFNFFRTCYLINQNNFGKIVNFVRQGEDRDLLLDFFQQLLTKNDDESYQKLFKYPHIIREIVKSFNKSIAKYQELTFLNVSEMLGVTLNNGGKLGQLNNIYIKSFEKDCELLKSSIINGELIKYNRSIQDLHENIQFFISSYNSVKFEISRLLNDEQKQKNFMLDYIENDDRMRKRLIVEDQIPDSEKLSYNISIPIKLNDHQESTQLQADYGEFISSSGIDTLSLSSHDILGLDDEGFEMVEETPQFEDKNRKVIRSLFMGDRISALWNISQINGLVPIESLMILGTNHLYLIENYFHSVDGNVVDVQDVAQDLRDPILQLIILQSSNVVKNSDKNQHRNKSWSLDKLSSISKRQFLLRDIAIEMFFSDGASILITCLTTKERNLIYGKLHVYVSGRGIDYDLSQVLQTTSSSNSSVLSNMSNGSFSFTKLASAFSSTQANLNSNNNTTTSSSSSISSSTSATSFISATKKWKMGEMSNFYYLMIVNTLAGRTFNDLTQYPVFPWVIADYTSESLDLSNPKTFRDLAKPMGAQSVHRANQFKERFDALNSLNDHDSPAFHYGTHYSSAMIVTSYLIRLKPYVQSYLLLQGGKFDHADRLFNSILKAWNSASRDNTTDVRELTPEFFYLPEFLTNSNNFEFGYTQNGESPNNVELPPWAKGDPKIFIAKNREALESSYVSANLHCWIDLIFGFKQNGIEAERSLNVFHHLSYHGAINLDNINDDVERRAMIGMINNFGQTPRKLFQNPHPMKEVLNLSNYYLTKLSDSGDFPQNIFKSKLRLAIEKLEISSKNARRWIGRPNCITSEDDLLIRKPNRKYPSGSLIINQTNFLNIHLSNITTVLQIGHKTFLTGSDDGIINVWKCSNKSSVTLQFQCVLRGHFSKVVSLKFSKSFKIGVSIEEDNILIVWDLSRLKYIRKFPPPPEKIESTIGAISNDTGNIGVIYHSKNINRLKIYTVNGEIIIDQNIENQSITAFSFGSINDHMVDTGKNLVQNNHTYWSNEIFGLAIGRVVQIYELSPLHSSGWKLSCIDSVDYSEFVEGNITTLQLFIQSEVDTDEKLVRGVLKVVFGDSTGNVYSL